MVPLTGLSCGWTHRPFQMPLFLTSLPADSLAHGWMQVLEKYSEDLNNNRPVIKALASMTPDIRDSDQQSIPGSIPVTRRLEVQRYKCSNCGESGGYLKKYVIIILVCHYSPCLFIYNL